mgnify:CR=1 FL=1|jgi:plasmid stabilization system protein ParE
MMPKIVKWTPKADESFDKVIEYLRNEWTQNEISNFAKMTLNIIKSISVFPKMFKEDKENNIRIASINKIISLIYREKRNQIELLYFWNNKQNPSKLKKMIN